MCAVIVGSARCNEFGYIKGGQPGNQTGHECERQEWYRHELGWVVLRAKSPEAREKIAKNMEAICDNWFIGYDQPRDQTLYKRSKPFNFDASRVNTPCDTDCARAVRVCILYAGIDVADFYTVTEARVIMATGQFDRLDDAKYTEMDGYLLRGDILTTSPAKGHTVVVLSDGEYAKKNADTYEITGNTVNMRLGPGTEWPVVQVLRKYDKVHGTSVKDGWLQGEANGKHGYVSMKYLKPVASAEPVKAFSVLTGTAWMRQAPGITGSKITAVKKGTEVLLTGEKRTVLLTTWFQTKYDGKTGWISGKLLNV